MLKRYASAKPDPTKKSGKGVSGSDIVAAAAKAGKSAREPKKNIGMKPSLQSVQAKAKSDSTKTALVDKIKKAAESKMTPEAMKKMAAEKKKPQPKNL